MHMKLKDFSCEALVNILPISIIIKDINNKIVRINDFASKETGFSPEELEGESLDEVAGFAVLKNENSDELVIKSKKAIYGIHEEILLKSGAKLFMKVDKIPILDDDGNVVQIIVMAQNITEQFEIQEEALKLQSLADLGVHTTEIVHNLKNPLTASIGYVNLLQKLDGGNEILDRLDKSNKKILGIVTDILSTTKNANSLKYETEPFNVTLDKVLEDVIKNKDSSIKSYLQTDIDLEHNPNINPLHLFQVLGNLINNAIEELDEKDEGKALVIQAIQIGSKAAISIRDNGRGIDQDKIDLIFKAQFTTKNDKEADKCGTGLGLSYCKRMLEFYDGRITVDSIKGEGTKFTLYLPIKD